METPLDNNIEYNAAVATCYDSNLESIDDLTWLPWIGCAFPESATAQKILIVGESHYTGEKDAEKVEPAINQLLEYRDYTRDVIWECPVNELWRNKTLENIQRLLFGVAEINPMRFWTATAYYNFIQRPLKYGNERERPIWDDWVKGWRVFFQLVGVLQPKVCVFLGLEAANSFNFSMKNMGVTFTDVVKTKKLGRCWARGAQLEFEGRKVELSFVQHPSQYFSWRTWHEYMHSIHPDLIDGIMAGCKI
jgi:hypothetical protein